MHSRDSLVRRWRWVAALALTACGPDLPGATATESATKTGTTASTGTTGMTSTTLGESSTTGTQVCLEAPTTEALVVASLEGCTPPSDPVGGLEVQVVGWPDAIIDEFGAGEGTIDAICTVVAITQEGALIDVDFDCGAPSPPLLLRIGSDAQRFPLCVGETVDLRYTRVEVGIPNGGGSERIEIRRPGDDALLAASYRRFNADVPGDMTFAPFSFEEFDLGCESTGDVCVSTEAGFSIATGDAAWTVPLRSLRLLPSEVPYVAFVADAFTVGGAGECEYFVGWGLDLTRAAC